MEKAPPVIILGAGLSGLAAALTLHRSGQPVMVIEPALEVGGRVKSRRTAEGFILDEGFQVLLNSYPELPRYVSLEKLKLSPFNSGALIYNGSGMDLLANPMVHPDTLISGVFHKLLTLSDKARILALIATAQLHRSDGPPGEASTAQFLAEFGFSSEFIEKFWRPFLTGVLLDPHLSTGADYFKFLIRCFGLGSVSLPAEGMQALPREMATQLPVGTIRLGQRARHWSNKEVVLENGEVLSAQRVIVAFDPGMKLEPQRESPKDSASGDYRQVTTTYFTSPKLSQLGWEKWLVLVPRSFNLRINHLALLTSISPSYGPEPLLSVSVVGQTLDDPQSLIAEIETLAGGPLGLRLVGSIPVRRALPARIESQIGFAHEDGVFYCGDRWASPSINGALRSGRLAAEAALAEIGASLIQSPAV